jgi:hypothetical protein
VADSCGYGVPLLAYEGERSKLTDNMERAAPGQLESYRASNNAVSIDGLPGLDQATLPNGAGPATLAP